MNPLVNLDLFIVGNAVTGIAILGFIVFFSNYKSVTSRAFLIFCLVTVFWSVANYFQYKVPSATLSFSLVKLVIFFGVWHSFSFFQLAYVFPDEEVKFSSYYKYLIIPIVFLTSILTLSPLVFSRITSLTLEGKITKIENGPGIAIFGLVVLGLVISGLFLFIKKTIHTSGIQRSQFKYVLLGLFSTFVLLMIFNFILPAFFDNPAYIPYGPVFLLPFAAFTTYAILKHHLLNVKVVATEILTFVLAIVSFFEVVIADNILILIFRSGILVLTLAFGLLLIKSVRNEIEQREKVEQLNKELEAAKEKLEELSRFKTQLLSLASHQIKSPLAAIKGFISIMLQGLYGPIEPKIRDTLEKMKHSSDELIDLINSVLDLRKVEEGKMEYSFERISLTAMVKGVVDEIQPLATGKGLKLEAVLPANEIFVNADKTKLKQVVQNLIDNSIKYTPEGFVCAGLREEDGPAGKEVVFSVNDSGLGLSAELVPHLFSEFVRDERVKKEIRGTGFGLYIAKGIIEAHGGKIWAESPGEGKGSTFAVRLKEV